MIVYAAVFGILGGLAGFAIGQVILWFWMEPLYDLFDKYLGPPFEWLLDRLEN